MATEVLRPQDCLIERIRVPPAVFSRRRNYGGYCNYNNYVPNSRPSRKPSTRPERQDVRKRVVVSSQPVSEPSVSKQLSCDDSKMAKGSGLVMEKVTIIRRGQSLDSKIKSEVLKMENEDSVVCGTQRLGPDPEMVPKQIGVVKNDMYAGSAFAVSPSPSALPLPSFSKKKKQCSTVVDDSATRDLRRLLRLE